MNPEDLPQLIRINEGLLYCIHVQFRSSQMSEKQPKILLDLLFDNEDGGSPFLRNVGKLLPLYSPHTDNIVK
jgi:hypothetical protein